jgi:hypothetical protein
MESLMPADNPIVHGDNLITWFVKDKAVIVIEHDKNSDVKKVAVKDTSDGKDVNHVFNAELDYMTTNFCGDFPSKTVHRPDAISLPLYGIGARQLLTASVQEFLQDDKHGMNRRLLWPVQMKAIQNVQEKLVTN